MQFKGHLLNDMSRCARDQGRRQYYSAHSCKEEEVGEVVRFSLYPPSPSKQTVHIGQNSRGRLGEGCHRMHEGC